MKKERLIYSTEITEIIGRPPRFILRAGGVILLIIIVLILFAGNYIPMPDSRTYKIKIFGKKEPLYITGSEADKAQYDNLGTTVISEGKLVALQQTGTDREVKVIAPFDGVLMPYNVQSPGRGNKDTLALFVPHQNVFRFTVQIPAADYGLIGKGSVVDIDLPSVREGGSEIKGKIEYQYPATNNTTIAYSGTLDSASGILLNRSFSTYTNLDASIRVKHKSRPILRQLLN